MPRGRKPQAGPKRGVGSGRASGSRVEDEPAAAALKAEEAATNVAKPSPDGTDLAPELGTDKSASPCYSEDEIDVDGKVLTKEMLEEEQALKACTKNKDEESSQPQEPVKLSDLRFRELDQLLEKSVLYSKFLSEHLEADVLEAAKGDNKGKGGQGPSKRRKVSEGQVLSTDEMQATLCPLIEGAKLRDYQLAGVRWLISLWANGMNGILADQMGLGKTLQTISFLSHLRTHKVHGPFLVIAPLSTLSTWVSEFGRFAPSIPTLLYHGPPAERARMRAPLPTSEKLITDKFPVVITSYEIIIADANFLRNYPWKVMIVDEGHRLKNFQCKLLQKLKLISTTNKFLLTGTPLQNNLAELWSLLNFLLPDVFADLNQFQSWFDFSSDTDIVEQERRNKVISKLHHVLRPFLLRRIKTDVELSLPAKKEFLLYAEMSSRQHGINTSLLDKSLPELLESSSNTRVTASFNNLLMQLRKNANHPDLITGKVDGTTIYPPADQLEEESGKLALMTRLLQKLTSGGHKVLIFSQMTQMLDILGYYLEEKGLLCCRLDGSMAFSDRQEQIKQFNENPEAKVFLLSTRAGGLGLNLTAADTVIFYDSDWNPQQDLQAQDRVHRIGQTKPVHIYRLLTAHSVDGKMLDRAGSKLKLESLVIGKGRFNTATVDKSALDVTELVELLKGNRDEEDDLPQSGVITEEDLDRLMDRSDLEGKVPSHGLLPSRGQGWEVVDNANKGKGLLSSIK
eukprot:jgi/Chlat1/5235/Chrsp33S08962